MKFSAVTSLRFDSKRLLFLWLAACSILSSQFAYSLDLVFVSAYSGPVLSEPPQYSVSLSCVDSRDQPIVPSNGSDQSAAIGTPVSFFGLPNGARCRYLHLPPPANQVPADVGAQFHPPAGTWSEISLDVAPAVTEKQVLLRHMYFQLVDYSISAGAFGAAEPIVLEIPLTVTCVVFASEQPLRPYVPEISITLTTVITTGAPTVIGKVPKSANTCRIVVDEKVVRSKVEALGLGFGYARSEHYTDFGFVYIAVDQKIVRTSRARISVATNIAAAQSKTDVQVECSLGSKTYSRIFSGVSFGEVIEITDLPMGQNCSVTGSTPKPVPTGYFFRPSVYTLFPSSRTEGGEVTVGLFFNTVATRKVVARNQINNDVLRNSTITAWTTCKIYLDGSPVETTVIFAGSVVEELTAVNEAPIGSECSSVYGYYANSSGYVPGFDVIAPRKGAYPYLDPFFELGKEFAISDLQPNVIELQHRVIATDAALTVTFKIIGETSANLLEDSGFGGADCWYFRGGLASVTRRQSLSPPGFSLNGTKQIGDISVGSTCRLTVTLPVPPTGYVWAGGREQTRTVEIYSKDSVATIAFALLAQTAGTIQISIAEAPLPPSWNISSILTCQYQGIHVYQLGLTFSPQNLRLPLPDLPRDTACQLTNRFAYTDAGVAINMDLQFLPASFTIPRGSGDVALTFLLAAGDVGTGATTGHAIAVPALSPQSTIWLAVLVLFLVRRKAKKRSGDFACSLNRVWALLAGATTRS